MISLFRTTASALVLTLVATFSNISQAAVIEADAGWSGFCVNDLFGSGGATPCLFDPDSIGNTIELNLDSSAYLQVTDVGIPGDVFDVYIDAVLAFTTSAPGFGLPITDPDNAFAASFMSSGSILLAAGSYSIDIFANTVPFFLGKGYIQAVSVVPAPSVLALMCLGLIISLRLSRRRIR